MEVHLDYIREIKSKFGCCDKDTVKRASKYIVLTGIDDVDIMAIKSLENTRKLIKNGVRNDVVKYSLVESYKVDYTVTINARSLQNFLKLRTAPNAHFEIRELAYKIYDEMPEEYQYLFKDYVYER